MSTDALNFSKQNAVRLLKALANEHRLSILCFLKNGEVSVTELSQYLPLSQSALSQHLAWLRAEQLVQHRREGQSVYYHLSDQRTIRVLQLLNELYDEEGSKGDTV
ncbi:MAG: transcriptional regulator [Oceanospirillaceae bacterium]|nr:transcriptional regulator [Oceanospirillaceae bacterium]|tara:strand:- start:918 stop:1235 length:318 start_codon:yes stop_codon:yes gene_type:complete